ncbi:MAG: hypothetical protein QNJ70_01310 [Xenococcaceae cyanobacterium MO_207.B15]|nr:hypothetical protein [Xenococcaceae cyanobacterium MO_207.B15]
MKLTSSEKGKRQAAKDKLRKRYRFFKYKKKSPSRFTTHKENCKYCYEYFLSVLMKKETIAPIKALLKKRWVDLSYLDISWNNPKICRHWMLPMKTVSHT